MPSWETWVAYSLLSLFIYVSSDWYGVREFFGSTFRIDWGYRDAAIVYRVNQLFWAGPLIALTPFFLISGLRRRKHSLLSWVLAIIGFSALLGWPGTWLWFTDMPFTLKNIHNIEDYWEAWRNNLNPDHW